VHFLRQWLCKPSLNRIALLLAALSLVAPRALHAEALLLVEADSGKVLQAENATYPWYPASVTKLMTAYVTLKAVKDGMISLDMLMTVSPTAAAQSPSKMGFKAGTQVTVDNALKMMLVKSANDMAVVLAEGVGGSIDGFSAMMNETAKRLGMTQTNYVNPNGLPDDGQITSARDLAILARAIIRDLPEYEYFMHIPSIRYGRRVTQNFNKLIGRYPGADGFKTGFICASGYNLVASATRNGKRLIAVVLGASSGTARAVKAAQLLERGFSSNTLTWLRPSLGVDTLAPVDAPPPNLRDEMCGGKRHKPASDEDDSQLVSSYAPGSPATGETGAAFFTGGVRAPLVKPSELIAAAPAPSEPIPVYTGPTRTGAALIAAVAADAERQSSPARMKKKAHLAAKKPEAGEAKGDSKESAKEAKSDSNSPVKPAAVRHANAKPQGGAKPGSGADQQAARPLKPKADSSNTDSKAAAKPAKPVPKRTNNDSKPAS
jgi:D-alanyl-D-alanine carboxypeptidase